MDVYEHIRLSNFIHGHIKKKGAVLLLKENCFVSIIFSAVYWNTCIKSNKDNVIVNNWLITWSLTIWLKSDVSLSPFYIVKDSRIPNYRSHASDPMYHPMKMVICETMNMLLICFACYEQFNWLKKIRKVFIVSYIHDIRSFACDKVSHTAPYQ